MLLIFEDFFQFEYCIGRLILNVLNIRFGKKFMIVKILFIIVFDFYFLELFRIYIVLKLYFVKIFIYVLQMWIILWF